MAFRIGRKFAQHTYPEQRRATGAVVPFARNFASGPELVQAIAAGGGTPIQWDVIDSGAATPSPDVPITTQTTGIVLITGVIELKNVSGSPVDAHVEVIVGGVPLDVPFNEVVTIQGSFADTFAAIPIVAETTALQTPVGVATNIQVLVIASNSDVLSAVAGSCTLNLQEVSVATG
jgi:hypothetical protein